MQRIDRMLRHEWAAFVIGIAGLLLTGKKGQEPFCSS